MKRIHVFSLLLLTGLWLSGCGAGNSQSAWKVYRATKGSLVNPNFPTYSFEYPSGWKLGEDVNHITFVSEASLLKDVPKKLNPGQIIVGLSLNMNMSPADMVDTAASALSGLIEFKDPVPFIVNGRPAEYREGDNPETSDQTFIIAVDIGENTRALLNSRLAEGEVDVRKETLMKIAESLQVEKQ